MLLRGEPFPARFRNSFEKPVPLRPNVPTTISYVMPGIVHTFKKGHRIRVDISSSNFPRFDVNPNTGEPLNDNRRWAIAINTIYHDAQHASQILLPIVPGGQ